MAALSHQSDQVCRLVQSTSNCLLPHLSVHLWFDFALYFQSHSTVKKSNNSNVFPHPLLPFLFLFLLLILFFLCAPLFLLFISLSDLLSSSSSTSLSSPQFSVEIHLPFSLRSHLYSKTIIQSTDLSVPICFHKSMIKMNVCISVHVYGFLCTHAQVRLLISVIEDSSLPHILRWAVVYTFSFIKIAVQLQH